MLTVWLSVRRRGTRVELNFQPRFVERPAVSSSSSDEATWSQDPRCLGLDVLHHIDLEPAGKYITNAEHARVFGAVLKSVFETTEDWLGCKIVRGTESALTDEAMVFTITEQDAVALSEYMPDTMDVLARKAASLLVLGGSMRLKSVTNMFESYGIKTIYVPLPIGPRKLLRAVTYALDLGRALRSPEPAPGDGSIMKNGTFVTVDSLLWSNSMRQAPGVLDLSEATFDPQLQRRSKGSPKRGQHVETTPLTTESPQAFSEPLPFKIRDPRSAKEIMLVEDNTINMKLLVALAKKLKLPYQCAVNGREALDLYRKSPSGFFLILMDLSMPVMDGHTSTARIRQLENELHLPQTTIVALTGVTNEESKQRAFDIGVDEYYTKPIRMRDIKKLVETAQTS